ncbi:MULTISPECIES: MATE family efflux transporter [unclassified Clostridioides]|uniref:MATE family efflux transporter n=1 Tax=unclassified Clostridioides TaxID=2635829 RepID=UPI001D0CAFE3|nr:MATE family efflux transporter [Clostridioides sp. ES-S-0001-02]MCC0638760.1 MATE family efflux transporter [Clostridioides sp. ES-S-0049-03]MCC0655076.1 MATE family efflux transporter [Clostridioides sp. ES-S-0123-01]MCC0673500.1 MATE family efflux transporter [Clostridioides sp. ES-S-0145-01]MCC0675148.1 MATE family efflux transporter [Clostridioides sp. ES-W-0018-02]MCC0695103.1 MATE family efflux transporter [Clostridioides sp. ES-S-0048-02]MCC0708954.1 MATE family efflux transporter [
MKDLTTGHEGKSIFFFAMPMLIGSLFQQLYNTADSIIVGRFIGKEAMAAVSGANPIMFLLVAMLMGVSLGFSILISQFYGSGDLKKVKATIDTTYILLFIGSILISVIGIVFGGPMLKLMNTPESVFNQSKLYLTIIFGGILFSAGYNSVSAILRGLGDSVTPLYFLIIATILNIVLDLTFIVVLKMGVEGVALATIMAQAVSFIISIIYLNKKHEVLKFKIKGIVYDNKIFKDGLRLGLPSGVQQMLFSIGNMALQFLVNGYGTSAMAAFGAGLRIENFISLPIMNLGSAVSTFVAQNIGAGENERVRKGIRESIKMALILAIVVVALILLFRENLISLFNTDKDVIKIGSSYLFIIGPFFLFIGTSFVLSSAMKGAGDSMFALMSSVVSLWLGRIPASYLFSRLFGTDGIWMGIPFGWTLGLIVTVIYYKKGYWKTKAIVNHRINE